MTISSPRDCPHFPQRISDGCTVIKDFREVHGSSDDPKRNAVLDKLTAEFFRKFSERLDGICTQCNAERETEIRGYKRENYFGRTLIHAFKKRLNILNMADFENKIMSRELFPRFLEVIQSLIGTDRIQFYNTKLYAIIISVGAEIDWSKVYNSEEVKKIEDQMMDEIKGKIDHWAYDKIIAHMNGHLGVDTPKVFKREHCDLVMKALELEPELLHHE